jgi:predicted O-methyltransferase YrrM
MRATTDRTHLARAQIEALGYAEGYFSSQILFSANELGVFDALAEGPRSATDLATSLDLDEDALERLLNGAVAVGLLAKTGDRYENGWLVDTVMIPGHPGYLGNWMRLMARWMRVWTDLNDVVRSGRPTHDASRHLGADPAFTRDFTLAMHDYARLRGREILDFLDLSASRSLLDLGGGPGTYSIMFAEAWPDLMITLFDLPGVLAIADENIGEAGLDGRVLTVAGDYHADDLGNDYDVVFISDVLHQEDPTMCRAILRKAFAALKPGGRLVIQAMFLDEDRTSPRWPVMHSLILLQFYGGGRAYTFGETIGFAEQAGFVDCSIERMSLLNVNSLVVAARP